LRQITGDKRQQVGGKSQPLAITFWIRYGNDTCDMSHELILDMLQDADVISNDRWVYETHSYKSIDRENPGVDILIEEAKRVNAGTLYDVVQEVAPGLLDLPPDRLVETVKAALSAYFAQTDKILAQQLSGLQRELIERERRHNGHELIDVQSLSSGSARLTWSDGEIFTVDRAGETSDYAYVNTWGVWRN
jgi:hypothetical protein